MKICSRKDIRFITWILAASMLLGGCARNNPSVKPLRNDPSIKAGIDLKEVKNTGYDNELMDEQYRRYSLDLFNQTIKDYGGDGNVMISPASVMMALDMVSAGAKGDSLEQLTDLFAKGQAPLTQQAYAADMMTKINDAKKVDFSCANAVWNNGSLLGDKVNMEYVDYIRETFLAEYTVTDFDEKTPDEINRWAYDHTDHMIKEVIDRLDPDTVMVLVNAISFDGKWETPYEEDKVREGDFHAADGSVQQATFLSDTLSAYYETDKATGFIKTYKGGEYAFFAILPSDENVSANEFAKNFTAKDYEDLIDSVTYKYKVYSRLPEFESYFNMLMNKTLMNLGAEDIFDAGKADLSGITGAPGDIFVSKVIHKTHIEVDAKGTRASAVTVVTMEKNAVMETEEEYRVVNCDRPFIYAIVDTETMAPIFIGTVNEV
ncbi:MAG: serpin family protein [Saccharofermentans sp.]|nr:serpin family protein [Saccharofermentans sp.]